MPQLNTAVALAAATVLFLGLISRRIETAPVSRPLLAMALGILAGPVWLGWLKPEDWGAPEIILREAARFALAISVTGIAIRTPVEDFRALARPWAVLLTLGMAGMWAVSAGLGWMFLSLSPLVLLTLGACVTPTDPVVSSSIVTGNAAEEILPDRTRSTLSLESGANDGLGYLIVLLPMGFIVHPVEGWSWFLGHVLLVGVLLAVVIGGILGWITARLLSVASSRRWVEEHSLLGMTVALSLLALTGAKLVGSDGILAAFAAGMGFNLSIDRKEAFDEQNVQETISKLFNLPIFVIFGAMIPVSGWMILGAPALTFAIAVLALRRPLAVLLCWPVLGAGLLTRDKLFLGWFGPVGVAAIYYALHTSEKTGDPVIWHITSLVVATSVLIHGLTSGPGLKAYRRAAPEAG